MLDLYGSEGEGEWRRRKRSEGRLVFGADFNEEVDQIIDQYIGISTTVVIKPLFEQGNLSPLTTGHPQQQKTPTRYAHRMLHPIQASCQHSLVFIPIDKVGCPLDHRS